MNWKLIFILSLSGPVLAIAGVYGFIGFGIEPYVMFGCYLLFALLIARYGRRYYFLQAMITVLTSGLLMTIIRLRFLQKYIQYNPEVLDRAEFLMQKIKFTRSPLLIMAIFIVSVSVITGLITLGLSKIIKKNN